LNDEEITEEEYILALWSSLNRPTVFLAGRLSEMRMNSYNKPMLQMTQANMDIQFCLDPYAAATYVARYMMKGQRGMSKAMGVACGEARANNDSVKNIVRHMGNVFQRASEVSAQEAVYLCLGLVFRRSSRVCKFVPTSPPELRTFICRQEGESKKLNDDSTDIAYPSLIDKYANRPTSLGHLSLAEFAAWYEPMKANSLAPEDVDDDNPNFDESMFCPDTQAAADETFGPNDDHVLQDADASEAAGECLYRRRTKAKILRYVKYQLNKDPDNFYPEQVLMFHPWRADEKLDPQQLNAVENSLLQGGKANFQDLYEELEPRIWKVRAEFEHNNDLDWEEIEQEGRRLFEEQQSVLDKYVVAPNMQQEDCEDEEEGVVTDPALEEHVGHRDLGVEMGLHRAGDGNVKVVNVANPVIEDSSYFELVRKLDTEQRLFFNHYIYMVQRHPNVQLKCFLTGGAGMGKSVATSALYHGLTRWFNDQPEVDKSTVKVLELAPTGAAAFEVSGTTIHYGLSVPTNQSLHEYRYMDSSKLLRLCLVKV
jgi:hypothetical protein